MKHLYLWLLALVVMVLSVSSCFKLHEDEDHHFKIYFENSWNKPVYIWYNIDWYWYDNPYESYLPLFAEEPLYETERCHIVQPGGVDSELMKHNDYYEIALQDQDSVVISVFDAEQPDKKDSECFLVRYHLSKEDLQKVNYHISFPPTEAMKDFYMKPSFEEVKELTKTGGV